MRVLAHELIGRRAELRALDDALRRAAGGQLQVALVAGPAGIGKSALLRRSADAAGRAGAEVVIAECAREDSRRPFGPFLQGAGGRFANAVGASSGDRRSPPDGAERHRAFAAIAEQLRSMARERPVVLVLEDVQWADPETLRLFPYLSRRAAGTALLLVATFRSEDAGSTSLAGTIGELRSRHAAQVEIDVPPLTPDQVGLLIRSLLGSTARPDAGLRSFIADHSGGNPLFVEELIRALVDHRWLIRSDGTWRSARPLAEAVLPTSVRAGVRARLGTMTPDVRRILSSAAVIGQRFGFDLLLEVTGSSREAVIDALRTGREALLIEESLFAAMTYEFRHALIRDALLEELIGPERQDLHRAVGRALEAGTPEADRSSAARELAYHFEAAGDAGRAVRYHLVAVRATSDGGVLGRSIWPTSNAGVAAHLERALALAPADHPDRAEMLREYAWAQDDPALRSSIIAESLAHAQGVGDRRGAGLSSAMAGAWRAMQGDATGLTGIRDGIGLLEATGTPADVAEARYQLARVAMVTGDASAIPLSEHAVELARAQDLPVLLANALVTLGPALVNGGRIEGIAILRDGLALARQHSAQLAVNRGLSNLWTSLVRSGASDDETREVERAIAGEAPAAGMADRWFDLRVMWTFFDASWDEVLELADEWSFPPFEQSLIAGVIRAYIRAARDGPAGAPLATLHAHKRVEALSPLQGGQAAMAPEILYLSGDHRTALETARYVARCMDRGVGFPFLDTAATAALAAASALGDGAAVDEWLDRCARRAGLEPSTAQGRRAYARAERAVRDGRREDALDEFARSAEAFERRGATLLARTLPRLRRAELLATAAPARAQKEVATVMAMWRAVDATWYLGHLREWAAAHGLRASTAGVRRGQHVTPRELEVARRVAEGLTYKEIGAALGITDRTAETHVQNILTKLDLHGRSQLAAWVAGAQAAVRAHT